MTFYGVNHQTNIYKTSYSVLHRGLLETSQGFQTIVSGESDNLLEQASYSVDNIDEAVISQVEGLVASMLLLYVYISSIFQEKLKFLILIAKNISMKSDYCELYIRRLHSSVEDIFVCYFLGF